MKHWVARVAVSLLPVVSACGTGDAAVSDAGVFDVPAMATDAHDAPTVLFTVGGKLSRWSAGTAKPKKLLPRGDDESNGFSSAAWSPSGDALMLTSSTALVTVPIASGAPATIADVTPEHVQHFEWLADGHRVLYQIDDDVFVSSRIGSVPVELPKLAGHSQDSVVASPDAAWVAAVINDVVVEEGHDAAFDGHTCQHVAITRADGGDAFDLPKGMNPDDCFYAAGLQWSADGRYLAYVFGDVSQRASSIFVVDVQARAQLEAMTSSAESAASLGLRWRSEGHDLIIASQRSAAVEISVYDAKRGKQTLAGQVADEIVVFYAGQLVLGMLGPVIFASDDLILVCGHKGLWQLQRDGDEPALRSKLIDSSCYDTQFSPDRTHLAVASQTDDGSKSLHIVSLQDGSVTMLEHASFVQARAGAWSADSKKLAYTRPNGDKIDLMLFLPDASATKAQKHLSTINDEAQRGISVDWAGDDTLVVEPTLYQMPPTLRVFDVASEKTTKSKWQFRASAMRPGSTTQAFCTREVTDVDVDRDADEDGESYRYLEPDTGTQRLLLWWRSQGGAWHTQLLDERTYDGTGECFIP